MQPSVYTRQITRKLKLAKAVREIYKHSNLNFFPPHFKFSKPVLILSKEIQTIFSSVLLVRDFHFVICSCILSGDDEKRLTRLNEDVILFKDEFVAEIDELCSQIDQREDCAERLEAILHYLRVSYPQGTFDILAPTNLKEYVSRLPVFDVIFNQIKTHQSATNVFEPYLENLDFMHRSGNITKGTLMISPLNNLEGEVIEKEKRTRVRGKNINRAMHGDEVFLEGDKIVGVFKRKTRTAAGTVFRLENLNDDIRIGYVRPIDRRLPDIQVLTHLDTPDLFKKVVVHVLDWECSNENPRGVIFKFLGKNGEFEDEVSAIFEHFQIEYFKDSWGETCNRRREEVGESAVQCSDDVTPEGLGFDGSHFSVERVAKEVLDGKRRDLRDLNICSIDPKGCTDIDDALHCRVCDGYIEVGVHIADVSSYVLPDSVLDIEARYRSTTVYFPDRRIDMLPPFLSSNLCSLLEERDRAAFSCVWKLDGNFNIIGTDVFRSLVRSKAAFTYEEANDVIKYGSPISPARNALRPALKLLLEIATKLRNQRFEQGALELGGQEVRINSGGEVEIKEPVPTHYLVEEFMLLANITVASFIHNANPEYSLLRKHPLPSAIELDIVDATSSKTLNDSLKKLDQEQAVIVKRIITRSMQQALYFCSGESSDFYHYGLATDIYTHFTSPIRRYPDIVVHRTLSYILENNDAMIDKLKDSVNAKACSLMNFRHRNAQNASRMAEELFIARVLDDRELKASVVSVRDDGVVLFVPMYGIEGFVHASTQHKLFDSIDIRINGDFSDYCLNRFLKIEIIQ